MSLYKKTITQRIRNKTTATTMSNTEKINLIILSLAKYKIYDTRWILICTFSIDRSGAVSFPSMYNFNSQSVGTSTRKLAEIPDPPDNSLVYTQQ